MKREIIYCNLHLQLKLSFMKTVFLDTNIFKFGTTGVLEYGNYPGSASFLGYRDPNEKLPEHMAVEIRALRELIKKHAAELSFKTSIEVFLETMRCTTIGEKQSIFDGVQITPVKTPIQLDRPLINRSEDILIFSQIKHARFLELQKATGAFQGETIDENQLIDTLHIWTAENNLCDFFLTLDLKLVRQVQGHKKHPPRIVVASPSLLLGRLSI